jgi:hypothetical protein
MSKTVRKANPKSNPDQELDSLTTKSAKIRFLDSKGMKRGDIAKKLGIRYQHVRNVLVTPIKKTA